jgi:hypothetical protein
VAWPVKGYNLHVVLADILVAFTSICGGALAIFLLTQEWKLLADARKQIQELPPDVRRRNVLNVVRAFLGMLVTAGLIFGTYEWGAHTWTPRVGAAVAFLFFVMVMAVALTAMVVQASRESQRDLRRGKSV